MKRQAYVSLLLSLLAGGCATSRADERAQPLAACNDANCVSATAVTMLGPLTAAPGEDALRLWIDDSSTSVRVVEVHRGESGCASTLYSLGVRFSRRLLGGEQRVPFFDSTRVEPVRGCEPLFARLYEAGVLALADRPHADSDPYAGYHCPYVVYRLESVYEGARRDVRFWSLGPGQAQGGDMMPYKAVEGAIFEAFPALHDRFRTSILASCYYDGVK